MKRVISLLIAVLERGHKALHYDFCPAANRWVYWMKHPLCCATAAGLAALLCGIFVNAFALAIFAILAAVSLLGIVWPRISIRGIDCALRFPAARIRETDAAQIQLVVRNRWPWPVWGLFVQTGLSTEPDRGRIALTRVNGWSTSEFQWGCRPERRGVYPVTAPVVATGFPFGIWIGRRPAAVAGELIVWPRSARLGSMPDAVELHPCQERMSTHRAGDFGDVLGTREFRPGDSLRRVHWSQTARFDRLIVTERQAPAMCALQVFIDVDASDHDGTASDGTLERTLQAAASICESMHAAHAYVECVIGEEIWRIGRERRELDRLLDALARIPRGGMPHASGAPCQFHHESHFLTRYILTTPRAFSKHLGHQHTHAAGRFLLIEPSKSGKPAEADHCSCRPWLTVPADVNVLSELPALWRRACDDC